MNTLTITELLEHQRQFFDSGATKSPGFRKESLQKLKSLLTGHEAELCAAIERDFRKSPFETFETELGLLAMDIDTAARHLKKWSRKRKVPTNLINLPAKSYVLPEPLGTCLIIGAWNYPYQLSLSPLISCMAAGNTAILKPSEIAPNTSAAMARIINGAFPPGYLRVVEGGAGEITALLRHKFDKIFFTGSARVGRIVYRAAAENLTPVTLELGGKSPAIIHRDCGLRTSVKRLVWAKFLNAGQTCVAPDYVLVHDSVKDRFLALAQECIERNNYSFDNGNYVQIVNEANFKRLADLINPDKVRYGGRMDLESRFIEPTIMTDVRLEDAVMQEEIFGPIMPVISFNSLDEAIALIQRFAKPLALYLFSSDRRVKEQILNSVAFGGGIINDAVMHFSNTSLPFGGVGESGFGSYHGKAGFDAFSHHKSIMEKPYGFETSLKYPPYTPAKLKWLKWLMGWRRK